MRNRDILLYLMIVFLAAGFILAVVLYHYDGDSMEERAEYRLAHPPGPGGRAKPHKISDWMTSTSQDDANAKRENRRQVALRLQKFANSTRGKVVYPPDTPKIIADFNIRRTDGDIHQGIDIWALPGQPIIAIADGRVIETYINSCSGPVIVIDHGRDKDGKPLIASYVHLQDMLVEEGQAVLRGDLIARLGDNYNSRFKCMSWPHLHLELRRTRHAVDGINPHPLWADGPFHVTCFDKNRDYPSGTITYPMPCAEAPDLPRPGRHPTRQSSWFENSVLDKLSK